MVIRQLQMISRVPRVFGWPTQPIMNLSVPLLGSGDELFEGPSVKPRVAERLYFSIAGNISLSDT